jgi:spermidine synthase
MTHPSRPALLASLMFASLCSGASALLNQVMWSRMLSVVFGSTVEAVAAVTAIFMAGLAIGSLLAPRFVASRNATEALALYSRIEFALGVASVAMAVALPPLESLRAATGAAPAWLIAGLFLLVPTALMGMTLVVQSHVVDAVDDRSKGSRRAGFLFVANTLGAMVGAYGGVLVFVPAFGIRRTIAVAALLNFAAAAAARPSSTGVDSADSSAPPTSAEVEPEPRPSKRKKSGRPTADAALSEVPLEAGPRVGSAFVLAALFVAGFAGLVHEVAWTRAFILVAGPTVHAFAFVVGAIVFGLSLGALLSSSLLTRITNPGLAFGLAQSGVAAMSALVIRSLSAMPLEYGERVRVLLDRPEALLKLQAEQSLLLLVPVAALSGALFPLGVRLLRDFFPTAQALGRASGSNTIGAILGAVLAGFVLLPAFGLDGTLRVAAVSSALSAVVIALQVRGAPRLFGVAASASAIGLVLTAPALDKELFAGGAYKYSAYDTGLSVEEVLRRGELVSYAEGRVANVSVKRIGSSFSLAVDGKVDATSGADMLTQRLLAHVPFLVAESPRNALVIGLGSAVTAGAALSHDPDSVTAVEISPEVVQAARSYFAEASGHALDNPRLRLVIGDARQHVLATPDRYDVIISEPSNPWMAGVSALFTREFFTMVKSRLAEGGVFCQWGHLYNMEEGDLKTLVATFDVVFPGARIYLISEADILIVGGLGSTELSAQRLGGINERARRDLARSSLKPETLSAIPTVKLIDLAPWLEGARLHTDDRPVLDFSAPLSIHAQTAEANRRRLLSRDEPADHRVIAARLDLLRASGSLEWTFDLASRALRLGTADAVAGRDFVRSAVALRRVEDAEAVISAAIERFPNASLFVARGLLYWSTARPGPALQALEAAIHLEPKERSAYLLAAEIQSAAENLAAVRKLVARVLAIDPRDAEATGLLAEADFKENRLESAARLADDALRLDPGETRALEVKALALAQLGHVKEARAAFERLIAVLPEAAAPRNNFGVFELQQGQAQQAARQFLDALDLDPSSHGAYLGLKEAASILRRDDLVSRADRGLARLSAQP